MCQALFKALGICYWAKLNPHPHPHGAYILMFQRPSLLIPILRKMLRLRSDFFFPPIMSTDRMTPGHRYKYLLESPFPVWKKDHLCLIEQRKATKWIVFLWAMFQNGRFVGDGDLERQKFSDLKLNGPQVILLAQGLGCFFCIFYKSILVSCKVPGTL